MVVKKAKGMGKWKVERLRLMYVGKSSFIIYRFRHNHARVWQGGSGVEHRLAHLKLTHRLMNGLGEARI